MWCRLRTDVVSKIDGLAQNFMGIWFMYDIVVLEPLVQWWFYMVSPPSGMLHKNLPSTSRTARDLGFQCSHRLPVVGRTTRSPGMHYQFLVPSRVSSAPWWPLLLCLRPKEVLVNCDAQWPTNLRLKDLKQSIGIWGVEQNFTPSKSIGHKVWFLPKTKYI